jgi:hypothetical protein
MVLRTGLEDEVEGSLGDPPEAAEPGAGDHLADRSVAGLGAEREPDLLGQRGGHAQQRGEAVVGALDGVEVVLDPAYGSTIIQTPSGARVDSTWAAAPPGSPMSPARSRSTTPSQAGSQLDTRLAL